MRLANSHGKEREGEDTGRKGQERMGGQKKLGTVRGMGRDVIGQGTGRKWQERKGGRGGEGS